MENGLGPATVFKPVSRTPNPTGPDRVCISQEDPGPLPSTDADIAYAPVTSLSHWIRTKQLTSERLTKLYLGRLKRYGPKLECVVTLTGRLALEQARRADRELEAEAGGAKVEMSTAELEQAIKQELNTSEAR